MDKRKLSAVPRAVATQEMIDMANRLGCARHMVTAELIEDSKILLLYFYEIATLKKGKTEAAFRTFLSSDDYITQDLKTQKVKWIKAGLENMNDFWLRNSHWNSKEKKNEYTYCVFIRSNEEKKLISDFFSEYKGSYSSFEEPWNKIYEFQEDVRARKLKERHKKETDAIDALMEPFKEPPQAFFDWVWETGMSFSRYVIYKEVKSGQAECECTHCGTVGMVNRTDIRLRNNEKGTCPFCGSRVTYKARGKLAAQTKDERWFIYVDPLPDGFALRYFSICRILRSDTYIKGASEKSRLEEWSHELSRAIYSFPNGKPTSVDYEWNVYKQKGLPRWCPYKEKWACGESILYPGNLPAAWEHTPMKYSALEILSTNIPTVALNYERGIKKYIEFPKLEWLCKMGLNKLAKSVIESYSYNYGNVGKINYSGKTIYDILKLNKVNTRVLQAIDGGSSELRLLQVAQEVGHQFKPEQLKEYYETFGCNTDLLKEANRKVSLHKLVKYVSRESEKYPVGAVGGCWMYAYNRYKEREDPRIERKQNMAKDWLEYLEWCKALKYDLNNMFIYMPKNFKAVHDRTSAEYQALQDKKAAAEKRKREREAQKRMEETQKAMEEIFKKNDGMDAFSIKGKGLILMVPKSGDEIRNEGEALHHCVGGYVEKVAKGETKIFFIRKAEKPDKPYYTMEWKNNKVEQCRGSHNCGMTPDVEAFTKVFEKKMLESIEKSKEEEKHGGKKQNLQSA